MIFNNYCQYLIRTIRVSGTKFLLTSNFVIFWVTKIAIRTSTDRTVRTGFTNSISTADNRSSTNILTFSLSKTKKRKRILNFVFELVWSVFKHFISFVHFKIFIGQVEYQNCFKILHDIDCNI